MTTISDLLSLPPQYNNYDDGEDLEESFSATPSIFEVQYENGRTYHNFRAGRYLLPNDEIEQERLDLSHQVWLLLLDNLLHLAPIPSNPKRILDLGTGNGNWAIEAGDLYPTAEIIGIDLSPSMSEWVPLNVRFEVDDIEAQWLWRRDSFDLIHGRCLSGSIYDWPKLLANAYEHLAPGGHLELQEIDITHPTTPSGALLSPDSPLSIYTTLLQRATTQHSTRLDIAPSLPSLLADAGFVDIRLERREIPILSSEITDGSSSGKEGRGELEKFALPMAQMGLEAYALAFFTRVSGMSELEARVVVRKAEEELLRLAEGGGVVYYAYVVHGRKPNLGEGGVVEV